MDMLSSTDMNTQTHTRHYVLATTMLCIEQTRTNRDRHKHNHAQFYIRQLKKVVVDVLAVIIVIMTQVWGIFIQTHCCAVV